jgi:hypothetical protein
MHKTASTVHVIKSPPAEEKVIEEIIERKVTTVPVSEAPSSVRDWDHLKAESIRSTSPKRRSRSRHPSRSRRDDSPTEKVIEKRTIIREVSPARSSRSHRRHSSVPRTEIIERREIIEENDIGESNSIHAGPLALVVDRHPKTDRDIKEEIRALEAERRALRSERVEIRRPSSRYVVEEDREIVIARPTQVVEEVVEVRKDKKGRMSLVVPKPKTKP